MSKKPKLTDVDGVGPKLEEKLIAAGFKTVAKVSKSDPAKLATKVDGLSESRAADIISSAKKFVPEAPKAKKAEPKKEKPKKAPAKKKAEPKAKIKKTPAQKKAKKKEIHARDKLVDQRLLRISKEMRRKQPQFRHEQAHRWTRVSDTWKKLRGIDNATREKRKGRIAMVSPGYRKPKAVRGMHPSRFIEVLVYRPADFEELNPEIHAIRIGATVGMRKRQAILKKADAMSLRVLNPGAPEGVSEEDLFSELDVEVD
ncbi:MAG: 50S ribosomal protein L32e [Candidatus Thorarchaeota archaeon]|nr:50S ribosomal protein L32e [Candidatus Thorarchaeota archaeon]